jgi:hypothetical protein
MQARTRTGVVHQGTIARESTAETSMTENNRARYVDKKYADTAITSSRIGMVRASTAQCADNNACSLEARVRGTSLSSCALSPRIPVEGEGRGGGEG